MVNFIPRTSIDIYLMVGLSNKIVLLPFHFNGWNGRVVTAVMSNKATGWRGSCGNHGRASQYSEYFEEKQSESLL